MYDRIWWVESREGIIGPFTITSIHVHFCFEATLKCPREARPMSPGAR